MAACRCRTRGIQALLDSSIRNIWQAREIKKGLPAFQVGPTCYRGLWIVDGAFLLEAAAMLGAGDQARNGVAYELTNQKADGRIEVMQNYWKENGIVLWTCVRHAQLTQDKAWLESTCGPNSSASPSIIKLLRQKTLENKSTLDDGLQPAGFPDGGIGGVDVMNTPTSIGTCWACGPLFRRPTGWARRKRPTPGRRNTTTSWRRSARPPPAT